MKWSDLKEAVGKVAPTAGVLLGGARGEMAGRMIATTLGVAPTPEAVHDAVQDPATARLLMQMENGLMLAELADVDKARKAHAGSFMPAVISLVLIALWAAGSYYLIQVALHWVDGQVPTFLDGIIVSGYGGLTLKFGSACDYWLGTTRASFDKTNMLANRS